MPYLQCIQSCNEIPKTRSPQSIRLQHRPVWRWPPFTVCKYPISGTSDLTIPMSFGNVPPTWLALSFHGGSDLSPALPQNVWLIYKNGVRFFTYFWSNAGGPQLGWPAMSVEWGGARWQVMTQDGVCPWRYPQSSPKMSIFVGESAVWC